MTPNPSRELLEIKTYGVKYIGSKRILLPYIGDLAKQMGVSTALDVFTGTTRVAQYFRQIGIKTYTSDLSWASEAYANTFVHNPRSNIHLEEHIKAMNALSGEDGWLTKNYTGNVPEDEKRGKGRCWQRQNAMKADAARDYVETLNMEPWEKDTLITSIIFALDRVDNTVGVQQAYLKEWCKRSYKPIVFELPHYISGPIGNHIVGDALKIDYSPFKADLAYMDPPYSPHSYATYYHIWDSVRRWDKPDVALTARRRIDRVARTEKGNNEKYDSNTVVSKWNLRNEAINAFRESYRSYANTVHYDFVQ